MSNTNNVVRQINDLRQNLGEQAFRFSTFDTNVCKGMAILFMILHHAVGKYYNDVDLSWYSANANSTDLTSLLFLFLSTAGKVCVPLFTVLSGFGIAKSYSAFLGGEAARRPLGRCRVCGRKVSEIVLHLSADSFACIPEALVRGHGPGRCFTRLVAVAACPV